jgi:hypothetical protein
MSVICDMNDSTSNKAHQKLLQSLLTHNHTLSVTSAIKSVFVDPDASSSEQFNRCARLRAV